MNLNEETYFQIQDFLQGKLKGGALEDFPSRLSSNPDLRAEVEMHKLADQLIFDKRLHNVSSISLQTQTRIKQNILIKKILIASVGIGSIGLLSYFFYPNQIKSFRVEKADSIKKYNDKKVITNEQRKAPEQVTENIGLPNSTSRIKNLANSQELNLPAPSPAKQYKDTIASKSTINSTEANIPSKKVENEVAVSKVDNCDNIQLKASVTVKNACVNESNGAIYVNNFEGGKAPYHFKILSTDKKEINSLQVPEGKYEVIVTDLNHCERTYSDILLKGIFCLEEEKSFNPSIGEILDLGEANMPLNFTVLDKNGTICYSKDFSGAGKIEWNGINSHGNIVPGYYIYYLKFKDGTHKQGEVTVTQ